MGAGISGERSRSQRIGQMALGGGLTIPLVVAASQGNVGGAVNVARAFAMAPMGALVMVEGAEAFNLDNTPFEQESWAAAGVGLLALFASFGQPPAEMVKVVGATFFGTAGVLIGGRMIGTLADNN